MCLVLMLGLSAQTLYAQSIAVTGRVKNKNTGELLVGASVSVKGKSVALTDANGRFSLNTAVGSILEITYTGLITSKVTVVKAGEVEVSHPEKLRYFVRKDKKGNIIPNSLIISFKKPAGDTFEFKLVKAS